MLNNPQDGRFGPTNLYPAQRQFELAQAGQIAALALGLLRLAGTLRRSLRAPAARLLAGAFQRQNSQDIYISN